jgi:hypothetical protein
MLKKSELFLIATSFLLLPSMAVSVDLRKNNPGFALMSLYANGPKQSQTINPYIVNIIAINEIDKGQNITKIKTYLVWYLNHLNYPDLDGLTGTIYDYEISETGKETATNAYDSVDGYAGTFLYLVNYYHLQTGDQSLIEKNWHKLRDISYLIPYLQDRDGLTKVRFKGKWNVKYLMDNCEAYAGIKAFQELAARVGYGQDPYYIETAKGIKDAVLERMHNNETGNFYWAVDDAVKHAADWRILYPDALAQIFPIYFGLLEFKGEKAKSLWYEFNIRHGEKIKSFPLEQRLIYELTKEKIMRQK